MHRLLIPLLITAGLALPAGARADLDVVTTVPDLAAIARAIGGEHARVRSLSLPTQDPHWVDAKPNLTLVLNRADLLIAVGAELEVGWLPKLQVGARNPKVQTGGRGFLDCAQTVALLGVPAGPVDRSMGDIHPTGNPHYLHDPRRAKQCAAAIAGRMAELDPGQAASYRSNLDAFVTQLDRRRADWERRLSSHRGTAVITYHTSWTYLTDWLGLVEVEHLEPKPGVPPSPRHVLQVIRTAKQKKVPVLLQESYYPSKTGALIAQKTGARLVELPAGSADGQGYIERIEQVVARIEAALREAS
ncbi:metal ABC transporter substrate-binding protein [Haliangium sp.]|uniref:metal ABC transporter substrate-binding protein n=1 Tax=Haliangium sp. TaxID=2663208 RepID=UPI003D10C75D